MARDKLSARIMRAWEEGAGQLPRERASLALEIAQPPVVVDPAMPLHAHDGALMRLRIALFGAEFDAVVRCPACDTEFEAQFDLSTLLDELAVGSDPVAVEADGFAARVRPPTVADVSGLPNDLPPAAFAAALFCACVEHASERGRPVTAVALPPSVREMAAAALAACGMESPALDLSCGACDAAWRASVDIVSLVLRDIDGWAVRRLDEVHRLASAYHWSERDILALSPARRRFYLEVLGE